MAVEFRIRLENGSITISQITKPTNTYATVQATQGAIKSHHLGSSFKAEAGVGGDPGGSADTGPGGDPGGSADTGPGGGGSADTGPGGPGGGAAGTRDVRPRYDGTFFQMETQQESEWCWAAVAASVDHYFNPGSSLTQCEIASQVTGGDSCAKPASFDEPERLQDALSAVEKLRNTTGPLMFEQLQAELDADRPVCVRIEWLGGGSHFVAIRGYQLMTSGIRTIEVADPYFADPTVDFDLFPSQYHGGGTWTATYLTKS